MNYAQTMIEKACEQWIQELTDLSRRNNLLYYRDLKVGTLELLKYNEQVLIDFLMGIRFRLMICCL